MKRIATVILICVFIIGCFVVPSFASTFQDQPVPFNTLPFNQSRDSNFQLTNVALNFVIGHTSDGTEIYYASNYGTECDIYVFSYGTYLVYCSETYNAQYSTTYFDGVHAGSYGRGYTNVSDSSNSLYYNTVSINIIYDIPNFDSLSAGLSALRNFLDNPTSVYTKNPNVDAFLANTFISMGIKFESASDALSVGAAAWNYCIDENNLTDGDRLNKHDWDIDSFVNIVNAHSNFYLNWYKGYKVNENVCLALTWYLYDNFESSAGLSQPRAGTLSGVSVTRDAQYGYKGITNAATNYNMQSSYTFYSGSTLTYVNGSFVSETNLINGSQFLYEPSEVRRFIAFPPASVDDTSPDPNATGTLTNGDTTYDIDIQFPSLDWLKDLIIALINALTNLFTTIADFLSQILDAILGLFGDAFEGLEEFGQGIVDWISALFTGLSSLISGYLPSDISAIIIAFISLNIGVGLIKFVLGKV